MATGTRVGIFGVNGKMGREVCRAIGRAPGLNLTAGVDLGDPLDQAQRCQVIVDFTHPNAVMEHIEWCIERGIHMVIGTTGFTPERLDQVRSWLSGSPQTGILIASNFSIGAVLMMQFAQKAAQFYPSVEIIELHHPGKADAPSGTAMTTAGLISQSRANANLGPIPDETVGDMAARGAVVDGIHIHGVRLQGLVAHQQVMFGAQGETLEIRHDSFDRSSFMPGVIAAVSHVRDNPGLTIGIEGVLGL